MFLIGSHVFAWETPCLAALGSALLSYGLLAAIKKPRSKAGLVGVA